MKQHFASQPARSSQAQRLVKANVDWYACAVQQGKTLDFLFRKEA
jgi:cell envelope opacity-associated protein A